MGKINFIQFNRFQTERPIEDKFWEKVNKGGENECWEWVASLNSDGYGCLKSKLAHRVSWEIHFGDIPKKMYVCHTCDNRACVNPKHLFLGTQKDNMQDMVKKGRINPRDGENNPKAKLDPSDVWDIHFLSSLGMKGSSIAREFKISKTQVYYILSGKSWNSIYLEVHKSG